MCVGEGTAYNNDVNVCLKERGRERERKRERELSFWNVWEPPFFSALQQTFAIPR